MPSPPRSHPDRVAKTLADLPDAQARCGEGPFEPPGVGARDCRIDLKLLQHRALAAAATDARAARHLAPWSVDRHPDLWAGTVQDGAARGFAVVLEEALALASPTAPRAATAGLATPPGGVRHVGKELRRRKDLLVASAGARVRFSRREGLLFVDRDERVHSSNCLRFEARRDVGTLDGFVGDDTERPRLYSAQFLEPQEYLVAEGRTELRLCGRIGRGRIGWPCELLLTAHADETWVRVSIGIENRLADWRLRARFLGVPSASIAHECTDVRDVVENDHGGFVAFTLVRACGRLRVDGDVVATPGAQAAGSHRHEFRLGGA